jgi:hypothetical protein
MDDVKVDNQFNFCKDISASDCTDASNANPKCRGVNSLTGASVNCFCHNLDNASNFVFFDQKQYIFFQYCFQMKSDLDILNVFFPNFFVQICFFGRKPPKILIKIFLLLKKQIFSLFYNIKSSFS